MSPVYRSLQAIRSLQARGRFQAKQAKETTSKPRRASIWKETALVGVSVFAQVAGSRGTGPRATVGEAASFHRRARACPSPCFGHMNARGGQAPALRAWKGVLLLIRSGSGDPELQTRGLQILLKILLIFLFAFFNLTKTQKYDIINPTFNVNFICP